MAGTFYFYDLETSGFSSRHDRIMQFAGQRTDKDLNPIGEPDNIYIRMTPDVLPQPEAVLVHGITPQKTISEGISEAEFARYLTSQVSTPDTIMVGYNNIRFDNDFIRFLLWRNFHDAYEWSWKNGCGTWDLLDVVRMTRALRPEGIQWPFAPDGRPSNKLELLSAVNKLDHSEAHDALSDVKACLGLARLLKQKQPKLFDYLLKHRDKKVVAPLIATGQPLVYTSGRYPSEFNKTTVAVAITQKDDKSGALMYDLRIDPDEFSSLSTSELAERWSARGEEAPYFPVKTLSYNKCPAVASLKALDKDNGYERLQLHPEIVLNHFKKLRQADGFGDRLLKALDIMWPKKQTNLVEDIQTVDTQLYDKFVPNGDRSKMTLVQAAKDEELGNLMPNFQDSRLRLMFSLYQARNFPRQLNEQARADWEIFRKRKLLESGRLKSFYIRLEEMLKTPGLDDHKRFLLEELNLYAQALIPAE